MTFILRIFTIHRIDYIQLFTQFFMMGYDAVFGTGYQTQKETPEHSENL